LLRTSAALVILCGYVRLGTSVAYQSYAVLNNGVAWRRRIISFGL
jgi:hypothetical protein